MTDCPICGDELAEDGWCSLCLGLTAEEPPEGLSWVRFSGGLLDGVGRLIQSDFLKVGNGYEMAWVGGASQGRYVWDGERFIHDD